MPKVDNSLVQEVTVRGRKRFRVTLDAGTVDGRRKQIKRTFDTAKEAREWRDATRASVRGGRFVQRSDETLKEKVEQWLVAKTGTIRPATLYDYRSGIGVYVEALGDRPVQSIAKHDVEAVVAAQFEAGKSVRTVSASLGLLRQVLERCVEEELVPRNVAAKVVAKGKPAAEPDAFTADELGRIVRHIDGKPLEHAFLLTLYGLRRSELMALQWADFDAKAGTIAISKSRVEKSDVVGRPKTRRGYRTLQLQDARLLGLLKERRGIGTAYLVVDELGRPMRPERYSDEWKAMLKAAGVRYLDLRGARRSSTSAMREAGVDDEAVAKWNGHDENTMRKHYSVVHDDRVTRAGATYTAVLRGAG